MKHRELLKKLKNKRLARKQAFAPAQPPMDPAMMGGAPPTDPNMMGGAPPMDPGMMDPAAMGGMPPLPPPMDPAMMGGAPPTDPNMMGGAPPMDPNMMGGMDMAQLQQMAQELGIGQDQQMYAELNEKIDAIGNMLIEVLTALGAGAEGMADPGMEEGMMDPGMEDEGYEDPGRNLDEVEQDMPEDEEQVFSDAVQAGQGQEEDYISRQLRRMRG